MRALAFILAAIAAAVAPLAIYPVFLMQALCFAMFASAFNLLFGFTGLLSFGHAAFFGSAAYIAGYAAKTLGFTPELAIGSGMLAAGLLGGIIGGLAIRRQGIYFAMITFALAEVVYFIAVQSQFTGGEDGLQSVPRGYLFSVVNLENQYVMYYFVLFVFLLVLAFVYRIVHSPFGWVLASIRGNETRAISLGYRTERYKLTVFIISAMLSGIAGGTKTIVMQFASLTDVHWHTSGEVVLMALVGGAGTVFGPVVGAILVSTLYEALAGVGDWATFIIGAIFVVCVLAFREGIVGAFSGILRRRPPAPQECHNTSMTSPARTVNPDVAQ